MTLNRPLAYLPLGLFCFVLPSVGCNGSGPGTGGAAGSTDGGGVTGAGGSAGTGGAAGSTGGGGVRPGASYACVGGVVSTGTAGGPGSSGGAGGGTATSVADAGELGGNGGAKGGAGESVICVVGQSYCQVESIPAGGLPIHTCVDLTGALAACAGNPTCACICPSQGFGCQTGCYCTETVGGFVTMLCTEI
jgi:hypothetical protein